MGSRIGGEKSEREKDTEKEYEKKSNCDWIMATHFSPPLVTARYAIKALGSLNSLFVIADFHGFVICID